MNKRNFIKLLLMGGIIISICFVFSEFFLNSISRSLVHEDKLVNAPAILVLSGSGTGNRIKTATELFFKGFGEKLVFSGYPIYPETTTGFLMKKYALKLGVPESKIFTKISYEEASTRGESFENLKLLKNLNITRFILVTSAYHTKRSRLTYQRAINSLGGGFEFCVYPAPDPRIPVQGWWKLRTGRIGVFLEYLKFSAFFFNI